MSKRGPRIGEFMMEVEQSLVGCPLVRSQCFVPLAHLVLGSDFPRPFCWVNSLPLSFV